MNAWLHGLAQSEVKPGKESYLVLNTDESFTGLCLLTCRNNEATVFPGGMKLLHFKPGIFTRLLWRGVHTEKQ